MYSLLFGPHSFTKCVTSDSCTTEYTFSYDRIRSLSFFSLDVESLDFANVQEATNSINSWCATVTKNHITDIITAGLYILYTVCILKIIWHFSFYLNVIVFDVCIISTRTDDAAHSVILLANIIYFNGFWSESFDETQTTSQPFWLNSKANNATSFMTKINHLYYGDSDELDARFLRLPYNVNKIVLIICWAQNDS